MGRLPRRRGFIILFGTRNVIRGDGASPVDVQCPACRQVSTMLGKSYRQWFTLFFIPVIPMGGKHRFTQCSRCGAQFRLPVEAMAAAGQQEPQRDYRQPIAVYNALRESPADSGLLLKLMEMYAEMDEYGEAIAAARHFPTALQNSQQCVTTLGRIYLANRQPAEALQCLDAALAKAPSLGEAHYLKALAYLNSDPPNTNAAMAAARLARNCGVADAAAVLQQIEARRQTV